MGLRPSSSSGAQSVGSPVSSLSGPLPNPYQDMAARPAAPVRGPDRSTRHRQDNHIASGVRRAASQTRPASTIMVLTEPAATSLTGSDQPASHIHNEGPQRSLSRSSNQSVRFCDSPWLASNRPYVKRWGWTGPGEVRRTRARASPTRPARWPLDRCRHRCSGLRLGASPSPSCRGSGRDRRRCAGRGS